MGKKHKKHKSEKHTYEGNTWEKPLKLVLKVAGNEVTNSPTGSSSHDNFYEDKADYDKHKDKKKKKKKKCEKERNSPVQSGDEKKRKKMTKKKKGQDSVDTDWDDRERSHTPIRSDICEFCVPVLQKKEQTPLQEALNQLIRQLQRSKDPNAFFAFPVTDFIAPGYSLIIKRPMDFSTMRDKVKKEYYQSLEELKVDFKIMCENAMIYNKPETIYYKAAKKLLHSGMKILSPERLQSLRQSIDFMADVESTTKKQGEAEKEDGANPEHSGDTPVPMDTNEPVQSPRRISKDTPRQDRDSKDEALKAASQAEKELEQIKKLIEDSGGKLSNRDVLSELEFDRRKPDGTTTLGILNTADLSSGDSGYCPVKLGMMMGRLQTGINTLQGFKEDKRNKVTPVSYINYGPFSTYAPIYDSSFANISKEDSDLIYSYYGDESSLQAPERISEFLKKTDEYMDTLADNILDAVTSGEHSKSLKETETAEVNLTLFFFKSRAGPSEEELAEGSEPAQDVEVNPRRLALIAAAVQTAPCPPPVWGPAGPGGRQERARLWGPSLWGPPIGRSAGGSVKASGSGSAFERRRRPAALLQEDERFLQIIQPESSSKTSLTSLSSVIGGGLDLEPQTELSEEAKQFQQKLDQTTLLLRELQEVQNERLSTKPPPNIICLLAPSARELQLAEKVTENLANLASQVNPGDVSSVYGIRKAMGISLPEGLLEESAVDLTTETVEPVDLDALPENPEEVPVVAV
ncbi:LOW QUALITY PROTEIN: bromodomain-containing protein 7-like [Osmerus eperlanus]|uniref:LOW QUALITY PROTEIN: bromodomain-containing protein 7-like n=1 Tax=Osmerus eperlanus TaxID=29151 RepID=UPI002E11ACB0